MPVTDLKNLKPFQLTPPMLVATARLSPTDDLIIISTHTTHVGGDQVKHSKDINEYAFQLTPPMWVATVIIFGGAK